MNPIPAALAALLLLLSPAPAPAPKETDEVVVGDIGKRIAEWVHAGERVGFSGTVLAAKGGKVIAAVSTGHADREGKVPNTPATLFEIASLSKQVTAAAVLRIVDMKKLKLDDPISKHLPGVPESCSKITVRHLVQHTSGIPGSNAQGGGDDLAAVLPGFLAGGPQHEPGTHWEYWNQGYALLSEIIARASGTDFTTFCREALFKPAKLKTTCFTGDAAPRGTSVAVGFSAHGADRSALEHPYGSFGFQYRGMGGVVTSAWDLFRWDRALAGKKLLKPESRKDLFTPGLSDYALGWYVKEGGEAGPIQFHGGSVRGFLCYMARYPQEDGCLVVLSNRDDTPIQGISEALEAILLGRIADVPLPPSPLDGDLAAAAAGRYRSDRGREVVIGHADGVTSLEIHWSPPSGPVTRARLGNDAGGTVVLYEWTSCTEVELGPVVKGEMLHVTLRGERFERAK